MGHGDNDDFKGFKRVDPLGGRGLLDGSADRVRQDVLRIENLPESATTLVAPLHGR
jgi:hypothetical protein